MAPKFSDSLETQWELFGFKFSRQHHTPQSDLGYIPLIGLMWSIMIVVHRLVGQTASLELLLVPWRIRDRELASLPSLAYW